VVDLHFALDKFESRFNVALCLCLILFDEHRTDLLVDYIVGSKLSKLLELCCNCDRSFRKALLPFSPGHFQTIERLIAAAPRPHWTNLPGVFGTQLKRS
jgi:hypothetical protein